jgi:hypothetical protein
MTFKNPNDRTLLLKNQNDETSAPINRGGVPAERRKLLDIEECGFLPKAATLHLRRSSYMNTRPQRIGLPFAI